MKKKIIVGIALGKMFAGNTGAQHSIARSCVGDTIKPVACIAGHAKS